MKGNKTLVLDLDETLVHSSFDDDDYDIEYTFKVNDKDFTVYTKLRPGLSTFINELSKFYELVVFTASI